MGKGRPRAVEIGQNLSVSSSGLSSMPAGPVFYPSEEEFKDPLEYIYKIRPEAEPYGICKIVPPKGWNPPFALNFDSFTFPTKTQAIHQLQARPASCDSRTFDLEYNRFLEGHFGRKLKKKVVFEGEELDMCKLFNAVRRFGGYDKVGKEKKWGDVFRFVRSGKKISECAKHVLSQLYREHLYDYECYYNRLNRERDKNCKRGLHENAKSENEIKSSSSKRRRRNSDHEKVNVCKVEEKENDLDQICEQCRSGLHGEVMLLCDRCNKGWHIYCLSPPLKQVPPGNWYCLECLNSDKDSFGFVPGKQYSLETFRRLADRAKRKWFGSGTVSRVQIEKKFWEIVEGSAGDVEVMYGSDLDTSVYGSGFPRASDQRPESVEVKVWDEYCSSPWNLNNLPKLKDSMLRVVHHNITGVMVPWLYVGMLFSAFCWHFEDHCFYSMNYLHWGEPKCWYSVPGSEASAFEKVMRSCLPDLFDAQPDLLFQLVTMLNPSVLRENGVPVYSVLQEPGNFVITFPRSYHGGFNLGLNCAEAVNFAPADWLPHGGFGAKLYQLYHKPAVLSHEELLCVVAKSDWDSKAFYHLRKELVRVNAKERISREKLWKSGIIRSSRMSPRKSPEYVGTEEDPTCIICKQYLYLSAIVCCCRPSAFVCLEHWEHLCECKSKKLCLLYRHSLAELSDLVVKVEKHDLEKTPQSNSSRRQISCSNISGALTKKVKGVSITLAQLAEQWLVRSRKVLQNPFSGDAFATLLKEAEQFLWAGSEMDPVREVVQNLIEAHKWVEGVRDCLSKVESWSSNPGDDFEKLNLEYIEKLLTSDPVPCDEPGLLKLKDCAEEGRLLAEEIDAALSTCSKISELELLYSRACRLPIHVKQSAKLSAKITSVKVCMDSVRKLFLDKRSAAIDINILYKLKAELLELHVQVPETEMLLDILKHAESCQARCRSTLNGSFTIKDVEALLQEMDSLTVNIPELGLLKQYRIDASIVIARFNDVMVNVHEREDQHNVINELNCLLKDGTSLKIRVDELPLIKVELEKACCREKALKARDTKMPVDFLQQLMAEAVVLQIEGEKLFIDVSRVVSAALQWEEKAKDVFAHTAQMSEVEDLLRTAEGIGAILPSLDDVKDAVSMAKTWLENSKPFLVPDFSVVAASSLLKLGYLKELVSQSKSLKVLLEEQSILERILIKCMEWENHARSLLQDVECLYNTADIGDGRSNGLISRIEHLVTSLKLIANAGLSLGFNFDEIAKLENACSMLEWCSKTLSFCNVVPASEDVDSLMELAEHLSAMCTSSTMLSTLSQSVKWLKKASEVIYAPLKYKQCKLTDAEIILAEYQGIHVSFPVMVAKLIDATQKHRLWQEQVNHFFGLKFEERSWSQIIQLKECGAAAPFTCAELDMVLDEVEKIEKWKQRCIGAIGAFAVDVNCLLGALRKIKESMDRSLDVYEKSRGYEGTCQCLLCASDTEGLGFLTCWTCLQCYHLQCLGSTLVNRNQAEVFICPYCQYFVGESVHKSSGGCLVSGKHSDLKMLTELLSEAENLCIRIEERDILQQLVDQAFACKMCLAEIVDFEISYLDRDLSVISKKLTTALRAIEVASVCDHQGNCDLERALARTSWRIRVSRLLDGLEKPTIQQIQMHLKEGIAMDISPRDYFRKKLMELKDTGLQWADHAKKIAADSGELSLDKVFELIAEGENLPVNMEKELELLRDRSMLYCICRKPYDEGSMIACGWCGEWYHIECVKLPSRPTVYICPACKPQSGDIVSLVPRTDHLRTSAKSVEPKTPSPQHTLSRKRPKRSESSSVTRKMLSSTNPSSVFGISSGIDRLWWRNRKPLRRAARKRAQLDSLSPLFHIRQQ